MADEPTGAGGGMGGSFQGTAKGRFGRKMEVNADFNLNIPGLETAAAGLAGVNTELANLKEALTALNSSKYQLQSGITSLLQGIEQQAKATAGALSGVTSSLGGLGSGGAAGARAAAAPSYGAYSTTEGTGWNSAALQSASSAQSAAGGGGTLGGGLLGGGSGIVNLLGDAAMFPMRFMRDRIQNNRQSTLYAQQSLSSMAFATGRSNYEGMRDMMGNLASMPGGLMGTQGDVMQMLQVGRQVGATYGFGQQGGTRTKGYMQGLREMQMMTPGVSLGQLSQTLGSQSGNVKAAQTSAFYTSGAFSMVGMGGRQKSVSEWAEGILRWLENQRPGRDRGKGFTYGELLAQHFPGSNIDAWLDTQGVSPDMKEYFWTYAEGKSNKTGSTEGGPFKIEAPRGNLGFERLRSQTEFTKGEFGLGAKMGGQYANREGVNTWFNKLMAQVTNAIIPNITGPGSPLHMIQMLPDFVEDLLFNVVENLGPLGQIAGGGLFNQAALAGGINTAAGGSQFGSIVGAMGGQGDIGDIGGYSTTGGTGTAGLHPDMRRKVNMMMQANPAIRVNSGLRDHTTQQRLRKRGVGRVSGRPSAHTRGMAADLGPSSQYGWIAANAGAFGLSSGAGMGEPWHVGMGDDPPPEEGSDWNWARAGLGSLGGTLIGGIPGAIGGFIGGGGGLDAVGGAASGTVDALQSMAKLFGGIMNMISGVQGILTGGGLMDPTALLNAGTSGQSAGSFLSGGIGSFMNLLLGPFTGAGGRAQSITPFNANLGLSTNITLGGSNTGRGSGFVGGVASSPTGGGGGFSGGGGGASGNQQIGQMMAAQRGWTGAQWEALRELWTRESGWRTEADNPNSSAYGIPQALPGSKMASAGPDWLTNPVTQIKWGLDYIAGRYGDPSGALRHHDQKNWYATGKWATNDEYARLHKDEMVLPRTIADSVRASMAGGGSGSPQVVFHNTFQIGGGGMSSGAQIDMRRTVIQLADHLEDEMKQRVVRTN